MNHYLIYYTEDGPGRKELTSCVAQGSILSSDLQNISYDKNLDKEYDACQLWLNRVMHRVDDRGLKLAAAKTESVMLTKMHINTLCHVQEGM